MIDLNAKYTREQLPEILNSFLPNDLKFFREPKDIRLSPQFKRIKNAHIIAEVPSLDLTIFELDHASLADPRVEVTKEGFRILAESFKHRAIVAIKNQKSDQWRLSLMTIDLDIDKKGRVKQVYSNPRRSSYLLGADTKTVTPGKYLLKQDKVKSFEDLQKRFAPEVVNNEFYKEIAKLYDELVGTDKISRALKYSGSEEESHEFVVRLIGRIIFCWFLREKKSANNIPLIPKDLLSREAAGTSNYYHQVLAPLFFEVLNKDPEKRSPKFKQNGFDNIPYLNGGLFSNDEIDHYKFDKTLEASVPGVVEVPDSWLRKIFDLLELYNFTVDENTSYDIDLSIDPEMLGRVFENLLARINPETGETVRKATGSFYTPREIVDYMVDASLTEYLLTKTKVSRAKIGALVSYDLEDDIGNELTKEEGKTVLEALSTLTVLDPACGSGAFPIGMLQKIVFVISILDPDAKWWLSKQLENASPEIRREFENKGIDYIRKLGIIRQTIFGVDIQPIATEISRLRCFLTLIVDEAIDDNSWNRGIRPLPNLDFKFVTANTLMPLPRPKDKKGPIDEEQGALFEETSHINELRELRNEYFTSTNSERLEFQAKFSDLQRKMLIKNVDEFSGQASRLYEVLSRWEPFSYTANHWFDSEWMFGVSEGFDIVIANPPYIDSEGMIKSGQSRTREYIVENYNFTKGNWDLYIAFFEKGISLLNKRGVLTYISPDKWLSKPFGEALREGTLKQLHSIFIAGRKVFETANVDSIVTIFHNQPSNHVEIYKYENRQIVISNEVDKSIINAPYALDFLFSDYLEFLSKVENKSDKLSMIARCESACATSDAYKIKPFIKDGNKEVNTDENFKMINTGTISKYYNRWGIDRMTYLKDKYMYPTVSKIDFLSEFTNSYSKKAQLKKIIVKGLNLLDACLDEDGTIIPGKSTMIVTSKNDEDLLFTLGLINSRFSIFYLKERYPSSSYNQGITFTKEMINNLPLPKQLSAEQKKQIVSTVNKIVARKNENHQADIKEFDNQLNRLIYEIYKFTPEEIKIIETSTR